MKKLMGFAVHGKTANTGRTHFTSDKVSGENNVRWNGGKKTDGYGYIHVRAKDHPNATYTGYVREHRLVMEEHLGRLLDRKEVVHHIDGDRTNNSIENLELYESHSAHMKSHRAR